MFDLWKPFLANVGYEAATSSSPSKAFHGAGWAFPFPSLFLQPLFSVINQYCGEENQHIEETKATATETMQEDKG